MKVTHFLHGQVVGLPADIEISPTLRFEPEEPPPAANAAVGGRVMEGGSKITGEGLVR